MNVSKRNCSHSAPESAGCQPDSKPAVMQTSQLVIALTKGRILNEALPLLKAAGIAPAEDINASRKLIFDTAMADVRLIVLRGADVPTYVEFGSADMGVVGKDLLLEHGGDGFYEPLDLKVAGCRLMTAQPAGAEMNGGRIRVATKFTRIAKAYFAAQGRQIELIPLGGALELAPAMGLADAIVDVVDTGKTLKANGLEPRELIADVTARVIVNKASMKLKGEAVGQVLERLREAVGGLPA